MWRGGGIEEEGDLWNGCGEEGEQKGRKWEEKRGCGWGWFVVVVFCNGMGCEWCSLQLFCVFQFDVLNACKGQGIAGIAC